MESKLNTEPPDMMDPLCISAQKNETACVRRLLDTGTSINVEASLHGSARMLASTTERLDTVRLLVLSMVALAYSNEKGVSRNIFDLSLGHAQLTQWFLVDRSVEQKMIGTEPCCPDKDSRLWSEPRLFRMVLRPSLCQGRRQSRYGQLPRISWRQLCMGKVLVASPLRGGLALNIEDDMDQELDEVHRANRCFLEKLG